MEKHKKSNESFENEYPLKDLEEEKADIYERNLNREFVVSPDGTTEEKEMKTSPKPDKFSETQHKQRYDREFVISPNRTTRERKRQTRVRIQGKFTDDFEQKQWEEEQIRKTKEGLDDLYEGNEKE